MGEWEPNADLHADLARVREQLEIAQTALVRIDRGRKPMREIAAQALLDIAMVPYPEKSPPSVLPLAERGEPEVAAAGVPVRGEEG